VAEATGATRFERYFYPACLGACAAAAVAAIWVVPYLPTNDGPQSIFSAHVENHYGDPGSIYARQFELQPGLAARGFAFLYRPLLAVMPWDVALKVALSLMVVASGAAFAWLARALHPDRRGLGVVGFALAFTWPFYMGFFSFSIATTVGVALAAYCASRAPLSTGRRLAISVLLVASLTLHAFGGALAAAMVGAVVLLGARPEERKREVYWLAITAVPVAVAMALLATSRGSLEKMPFSEALVWQRPGIELRTLPRLLLPGPVIRGLLVAMAAVLALALFVRQKRWRTSRETGVFALGLVLLLAGVVSPLHIPGWQLFGPRFLALGVMAAVALWPLERLRAARRLWASGALALATLISLGLSARLHARLYDGCRDLLSGLARPFVRTSLQLPISVESYHDIDRHPDSHEVPYANPRIHIAVLYPVAHGGSTPWVFQGTGSVHALRPKLPPPVPIPPAAFWTIPVDPDFHRDDRLRRASLTDVAAWGVYYENLLTFGTRPEDRQLLAARGYETEWEQGALWMARFEPCSVGVMVTLAAPAPALEVSYGAWGLRELGKHALPAEGMELGKAVPVEFPTLCGELWVLVRGVGTGAHCRQARPDGKQRVTAVRPRTEVACDVEP